MMNYFEVSPFRDRNQEIGREVRTNRLERRLRKGGGSHFPRIRRSAAFLALALLVALATVSAFAGMARQAEAAFPGQNGAIAFASHRITSQNPEGDSEIFLYFPGSGAVSQLTFNNAIDSEPAWSPDGRKIVFTSTRDTSTFLNFEVYKMNANGTGQVNLTNNPNRDSDPVWSPDGRRISFTSHRPPDFDSQPGNYEVYTMKKDGSEVINITQDSAEDSRPDWRPLGN